MSDFSNHPAYSRLYPAPPAGEPPVFFPEKISRTDLAHLDQLGPQIDRLCAHHDALLAGFGRAAAEVGAVIIVGGNIDGFTRTMTTAIALETSKGDLPLAIGLGLVLIVIVMLVNALAWAARRAGERYAG